MKLKLIFSLPMFLIAGAASASDLNFAVVNTTTGLSTGSVDLSVSGGVAPFVFSWSGPSGFTANTEDISALEYGNYTVIVTDKYCGIATFTVLVDSVLSSGIDENDQNPISVFPNPANNFVNIVASKPLNAATFRMMTVAGKTVMEKSGVAGNSFLFDVSEQAAGIYFIEINNAGTLSRTRFVKN